MLTYQKIFYQLWEYWTLDHHFLILSKRNSTNLEKNQLKVHIVLFSKCLTKSSKKRIGATEQQNFLQMLTRIKGWVLTDVSIVYKNRVRLISIKSSNFILKSDVFLEKFYSSLNCYNLIYIKTFTCLSQIFYISIKHLNMNFPVLFLTVTSYITS